MLPLSGVKVVELANNIAGPYAGYILAMLGADVLKVERPETGDDARGWGPPFWQDTSATFHALNVNKRGITLDLKDPAAIAWLEDYAAGCDVLVHNLRPGVMEDLGLGSAPLRQRNPRLVYCNLSAFGPGGPMQKNPGYEPMVQAFAGLFSINGYPDRPGTRIGTSVLDLGSAVWAALGCIAGLLNREKTGVGCVVDASLYETALGLLTVHYARYRAGGTLPERHPSGKRPTVRQARHGIGPSRLGEGPALQDQSGSRRQQDGADRYGLRTVASRTERGLGRPVGKSRRAVRADPGHERHARAPADRRAGDGAAGARARPRPDEPAPVAGWPQAAHPEPRARARPAQCQHSRPAQGQTQGALRGSGARDVDGTRAPARRPLSRS
jgi:hypothetical protein